MARDTITIQEIGAAGAQEKQDIAYTTVVAANDLQVKNDGKILLLIKNGGASSQDVTVVSVADEHGRTGDLVVSTTNAKESVCGPFPPALWNQSDGYLHIDSSDEDSLQVAAVRFRVL